MAQPYFDDLTKLISNIDLTQSELTCKHFFSGAAFYLNQQICGSLTPMGLAFKLPQSRCEDLISERKAIQLQYFENSPTKQSYVLFPDYDDLSDTDIALLLEECLDYVYGMRA